MASIHKHSSGRSPYWYASFQGAHGKFKLVSTKQIERSKAMQVALEFERVAKQSRSGEITEAQCRKVISDLLEKVTGESVRQVSVEKFFRDWLTNKAALKSTATMERYRSTFELFLRHLGPKASRPLGSVTVNDIQSFVTARLDARRSSKTVSVDLKTLSGAFAQAHRTGLILRNPMAEVIRPKVESNTRETFSAVQVKMPVDAASSDEWKTLIFLGYFTGARLRDCAEMTWENIGLTNKVIAYRQSKTGETVTLPMHEELEKHLSQIASSDSPQPQLCPTLAEKPSGGKTGLSAEFKEIMRAAGIDAKTVEGMGCRSFSRLTFHGLRHSFTSALANAGVSQEVRMKLTGHKTAAVNANYTHHELETLRAAIGKLPGLTAVDQT